MKTADQCDNCTVLSLPGARSKSPSGGRPQSEQFKIMVRNQNGWEPRAKSEANPDQPKKVSQDLAKDIV
jgi:hypothetical protein